MAFTWKACRSLQKFVPVESFRGTRLLQRYGGRQGSLSKHIVRIWEAKWSFAEFCPVSSRLLNKAQALCVYWQLLLTVQGCLQACRTVDVVHSPGPELLFQRLLSTLECFAIFNSLSGGIEKPRLVKAPLWPFLHHKFSPPKLKACLGMAKLWFFFLSPGIFLMWCWSLLLPWCQESCVRLKIIWLFW